MSIVLHILEEEEEVLRMATSLKDRTFTVQILEPLDSPSSSRTRRRIYLNPDVLKNTRIQSGEPLLILNDKDQGFLSIGVAWPLPDLPLEVTAISAAHVLSAKIETNGEARLIQLSDGNASRYISSPRNPPFAHSVVLLDHSVSPLEQKKDNNRNSWISKYVKELLVGFKYTFEGQRIQFTYEGHPMDLTVAHVSANPSTEETSQLDAEFAAMKISPVKSVGIVTWDTKIYIRRPPQTKETIKDRSNVDVEKHSDGYSTVGGLEKQITQIRDLIDMPLTRPDLFRHFGLKPPKGLLLYGPPGTGKTHLARAIVASTRASVVTVNGSELSGAYHGETEERLRNIFAEARRRSPCIVVLDEVDALCPRREEGGGSEVEKRVVATLLTIMDGMGESKGEEQEERVMVIATTNRPNAIDPALRRPGRFDREIEIGIPDARARFSVLKVLLSKSPHNIPDDFLHSIANRAHGYVGADLSAVVREAGTVAIKRFVTSQEGTSKVPDTKDALLTTDDLLAGLSAVQPSAMREVYVEVPAVRWEDIGGQAIVQQKLRECIEWPLKHPESFARLGVRPPKGILLFGPPGCSKTLTARALATESGLNFIAVKGPELLNKYVGESERAVREIFRKARAASPSIVFFDEIDALSTSRSDNGGNSKHEGVLTTLLNEMDGVQELVGVTVVAATNRPDVIDSALMRPGRLDRILYVGPPDYEGRVEILRIRMRAMAVASDVDVEELARLTEGCSGAELTALCQDAALLTMKTDINAPSVPQSAFVSAAASVRRQITPDILAHFQRWRDTSGLTSA